MCVSPRSRATQLIIGQEDTRLTSKYWSRTDLSPSTVTRSSTGMQPSTTSYARKLTLKCTLMAMYCCLVLGASRLGIFHVSSDTPTDFVFWSNSLVARITLSCSISTLLATESSLGTAKRFSPSTCCRKNWKPGLFAKFSGKLSIMAASAN